MATILAVKHPGTLTEHTLYELGQQVELRDQRHWGQATRDYPGEGLLYAPDATRRDVATALNRIDPRWGDQLEMLHDPDRTLERRLARHDATPIPKAA